MLKDLAFRAAEHQAQHERRAEDAGKGDEDREEQGEREGGAHRAVEVFIVLRAEILGNDNAGAGGQPQKEADEDIDDRADGADGGIGGGHAGLTDDPGIDHVV